MFFILLFQDRIAHRNLGTVLYLYDKYEEAILSYKECLKIKPDDEIALKNLRKAESRLQGKMNNRARELTEQANEAKLKGDLDAAEELLLEVTQILPEVS